MIELPRVDGGFRVIVADPPWSFDNKVTRASADSHYPTMSPAEIIYMPVREIAAPNAHLALWTTDAHKETAFHVMQAWGFNYKCEAVWVKTNDLETRVYVVDGAIKIGHFLTEKYLKDTNDASTGLLDVSLQIGLGNYFRHVHETVLFGTRGKAPARLKNVPSVFFAPRQEHSQKPEILQTFLEHMGDPPGLELFANRQRSGWVCWGKGHGFGQAVMQPDSSGLHERPGVVEELLRGAES
jgi:N6-adenosine-specific RNA methylase IME4